MSGPTDCRGEPLELETEVVDDPDAGSLGPATSADLLELDAVPDPVDSDAPRATFSAEETTQRNRRSERP
jgi:hypothetical protein